MTSPARARPSQNDDDRPDHAGWRVLHTRGDGVHEIARLLAVGDPIAVQGDLHRACVAARAGILVQRTIRSDGPVAQVAPVGVDVDRIGSVVGAIGTGPHSALAARVATRLSRVLGVPGKLVAASRDPEGDTVARRSLDASDPAPQGLEHHVIRVSGIPEVADLIPSDALLVLGAAGGSWVRRRFSAPGRRMVAAAPAGAVVVHDTAPRAFQHVEGAVAFGARMLAADALRLLAEPAVPVAEEGRLVGVVRAAGLTGADPGAELRAVMEAPISVPWDASMMEASRAALALDGAPVPVVGPDGRLLGTVRT
ncbi:MAG: hypothetical protein KQH83_06415 [Actinobacteria bacterium]|nr:hypothetical protein [Actinomycetota bacterium]